MHGIILTALERLKRFVIMAYLDPASNQNHKGSVLKIAKVPLQINFKHSKPFWAILVNFWQKNSS